MPSTQCARCYVLGQVGAAARTSRRVGLIFAYVSGGRRTARPISTPKAAAVTGCRPQIRRSASPGACPSAASACWSAGANLSLSAAVNRTRSPASANAGTSRAIGHATSADAVSSNPQQAPSASRMIVRAPSTTLITTSASIIGRSGGGMAPRTAAPRSTVGSCRKRTRRASGCSRHGVSASGGGRCASARSTSLRGLNSSAFRANSNANSSPANGLDDDAGCNAPAQEVAKSFHFAVELSVPVVFLFPELIDQSSELAAKSKTSVMQQRVDWRDPVRAIQRAVGRHAALPDHRGQAAALARGQLVSRECGVGVLAGCQTEAGRGDQVAQRALKRGQAHRDRCRDQIARARAICACTPSTPNLGK